VIAPIDLNPITLADFVWIEDCPANCSHCSHWSNRFKDSMWGICTRIRVKPDEDAEILCEYNAELETSSTFYCSLFEEM
jgi:hypothetical protein